LNEIEEIEQPLRRSTRNLNKIHNNKNDKNDDTNDPYELRDDIIIYENFNINNIKEKNYQPFILEYCSNALILAYIHSHLCKKVEIMGFLGGTYDKINHKVIISKIYPLKEEIQTYRDISSSAEHTYEINEQIKQDNLLLLGWYHSHPTFLNVPSNTDLQQHYQHSHFIQLNDNKY